jgi:ABC-type multidrug transport system fused ATPase/permease subunit
VPQKETLISGTIFENIAYGSECADKDQVQSMARIVGLSEFIENHLPNGYDSDLGEVANRLSGGQKQRLSLARALIRNPKILLLDEANSALDVESERNIVDAIRQWAKQRNTTILTIAHRLSTARLADKIVVMKNGRIIDEGSHEALLERCDVYRNYSFTDLKGTSNVDQVSAQHRHAASL